MARRNLSLTSTGSRKSTRRHANHRVALMLLSVKFVIQAARASISFENVDIDLVKLAPTRLTNFSSTAASTLAAAQPAYALVSPTTSNNLTDLILASEAAIRPPIYQSAPKRIVKKSNDGGQQVNLEQHVSAREDREVASEDLATAAGHHKKKKKLIVVKKKKKKKRTKKKIIVVKKKKKGKKHHHKKKKKKVIYYMPKHSHQIEHHYQPKKHTQETIEHHHHEPAAGGGKYYEYRSVPKKGSWEFGFKRGNMKHHIERKEQGDKSHFKTTFDWKDEKGNGKHLFDYNHGRHGHYGAAATEEVPKSVEAVVLLSKEKSALIH